MYERHGTSIRAFPIPSLSHPHAIPSLPSHCCCLAMFCNQPFQAPTTVQVNFMVIIYIVSNSVHYWHRHQARAAATAPPKKKEQGLLVRRSL